MIWTSVFLMVLIGAEGVASGHEHRGDILETSRLMMTLQKEKKYAEALPLAEQVLQQSIETLGPNHSTVAIYMDHLGTLYGKMGQVTKAEFWIRKALRIREQTFGPNHLSVATSLSHLATIYALSGQYTHGATFAPARINDSNTSSRATGWNCRRDSASISHRL